MNGTYTANFAQAQSPFCLRFVIPLVVKGVGKPGAQFCASPVTGSG